ncbi:MAG: hypothetical protein ACI8PD_002105, partial [Nitrospinales bacterium]
LSTYLAGAALQPIGQDVFERTTFSSFWIKRFNVLIKL